MKSLDYLISTVIRNTSQYNVLLIRGGHSLKNTSCMRTNNPKLSLKGRQQSDKLFHQLYKHIDLFASISSSDLSRSFETAQISLGYPLSKIKKDKRLRQIQLKSQDSNANSQCLEDVKKRMISYYKILPPGLNLIFTHGGCISSQTSQLGEQHIIPNCGSVCLNLDSETRQPKKILFNWQLQQFDLI